MAIYCKKHRTRGMCLDCAKEKREASAVASNNRAIPPLLEEILKTFPLREPDRSVNGENGDWLLEWHFDGERYFEIEYTPEGQIEVMTQFNGEIKHWTMTGA